MQLKERAYRCGICLIKEGGGERASMDRAKAGVCMMIKRDCSCVCVLNLFVFGPFVETGLLLARCLG